MNRTSPTRPDTSSPAVILGLGDYGGLGIVRSLGRLGARVYGVESTRWAPGVVTRHCRGSFVWDLIGEPAPMSAWRLVHQVAPSVGGKPVLIPTSDDAALMVADQAAELSGHFRFPLQDAGLLRSLINKRTLHELMIRHGIPTPRTAFLQSRDDLARYMAGGPFPLMLKVMTWTPAVRASGRKMMLVRTPRDLLNAYDLMAEAGPPNLMLQEYIGGTEDSGWLYNGYFDEESRPLAAFTGMKLRQNPVGGGSTSLGVCFGNRALEETAARLVRAVGYRGPIDMDYRFDARDGLYKILDVNPRIGASFRLFVGANGLDIARTAYLHLTGQPVPADPIVEGRKWFVEDYDLRSGCRLVLAGRLSPFGWLGSFRGVQEAGYFSIADPAPFGVLVARHIVTQCSRLLGRIRGLRRTLRAEAPAGRPPASAKPAAATDSGRALYGAAGPLPRRREAVIRRMRRVLTRYPQAR